MRFIAKTTEDAQKIKRSVDKDNKLGSWLSLVVEDGLSKRFYQDEAWRTALRQYEAIPYTGGQAGGVSERAYRPQVTLEIPIGAKQCDTIVSAITDLVFGTSPPFIVKGSPGYDKHAYAFQLLVDKLLIDPFVNFQPAAENVIIDTVQMGTGVFYVVRTEEVSKRVAGIVTDRGPRCYAIPPEDFIVPGGAYQNIDGMQYTAYRIYYNQAELAEAAEANGWDVSDFKFAGNVSWVRQRREAAAKTQESTDNIGRLFEVIIVFPYYDYDEDGLAEDLYVVWDRTSRKVGFVGYAPYNNRPFIPCRYQTRSHVFYGLGVLEMARPFQEEVTEWHNFKMANAHLANSRFWAYRLGAAGLGEELVIAPNKSIGLTNPKEDLVALTMADMYPTATQYEATTLALADQRVGTNELGGPQMQAGKRTPATTAMSILQAQNRRFASPFNNVRKALAGAMVQVVLRLREQHLKGGEWRQDVAKFLVGSIGAQNAQLVTEIFDKGDETDIGDYVKIEVTATSSSINREADKQSAMMLVQVLGNYYEKVIQMMTMLMQPGGQALQPVIQQILEKSGNAVERLLRTFDNVRDPDNFILQLGGQNGSNNPNMGQPPPGQPGPEAAPGTVPQGPAGGLPPGPGA